MVSFLVLCAFFLMVLGTGRLICRAIRVHFDSALDELVFAAAAGLGLLSYVMLGIGLSGLLYPRVAALLFIILLGLALPQAIKWLRTFSAWLSAQRRRRWRLQLPQGIALILALLVLIQVFRACAPVTEWDSLYYHLAAPKIYVQQHKIIYIPYMINVNYVVGMEMINTWCLLWQNDTLPQLISVLNSVLLLLTIFALGKKYLSRGAALLACLICYTVPWWMYYVPFSKPDITLTLFATLAVYAYIQWNHAETPAVSWLYCAGLMAAFAAACKLTGAIIGIILIGGLCGHLVLGKVYAKKFCKPFLRTDLNVRTFVVVVGLFAILVAPWYLKNYVWTGNPVWPYLYGIFGGPNWSKEAAAGIYKEAGGEYNQHGLLAFLRIPWDVTLNSATGDFSPLFLTFLPLLVFMRRLPKVIHICIWFAAGYTIFWFYITQQVRFLFPILPVLSLAAAYAILQLSHTRLWRIVNRTVVGGFVVFAVIYVTALSTYVADGVLGLERRDEYLEKRAWMYKEAVYINRNTPLDSKVGIFFGAGYYVDREYVYLWPYYQAVVNVVNMQAPGDLLQRFKELQLTHLVWQNPASRRYLFVDDDPLFMKWQEFFTQLKNQGHLKERFRGNDGIVYEIL